MCWSGWSCRLTLLSSKNRASRHGVGAIAENVSQLLGSGGEILFSMPVTGDLLAMFPDLTYTF
jgi:hypothetical protein